MMDQDLPENLHSIKTEVTTPPTTPEKSPNTIRERLFCHVKRRLQQDATQETSTTNSNDHTTSPANEEVKSKEPQRTKRPYTKRSEKTNNNSNNCSGAGIVRKYRKQKLKQQEQRLVGENNLPITPGVIINNLQNADKAAVNVNDANDGINGEDDGSQDGAQDGESRNSGREKDKCPDVLAMVMSVKKRALMQNPEVQEFLRKMMNEIKN